MPAPTERFSDRVENYVKYRPSYPPEVLQLFRNKMFLQTSSVIADIGSGTGISAKIFLENGNEVFGIEPNEAMRKASEVFLEEFSAFHAVDGTAENTKLNNQSVDFIIAAQAFHWFDKEKTRVEFERILRPNGYVVLFWNERQTDSNEFLSEYEKFLLKFGTDYKEVRHEQVTNEIISDFFQVEFREESFLNSQTFDFTGLKGRVLSSSYMPSESHPIYNEMEKELNELFTRYEKNGIIKVLYDTKVFYSQF